MDIFTTQLARVVPVPIKPANLKVKALLKEAGTSKLKEDPDHLENHDYYFFKNHSSNDEHKENQQEGEDLKRKIETTDEKTTEIDSQEKVKHLDLYV
jgi:hypothetical protein